MLDIDETELIEFFEVLPSDQCPEEQEFFGTTAFDIHQERMHLRLSVSKYHEDLILDLRAEASETPFVELHLREVHEVRVIRDKPGPSPVLWITARGDSKAGTGRGSAQIVKVEVKPKIRLTVRNWEE